MKTVSAVKHIHFEDLGIFENLLKKLGFGITYIDAPTAHFDVLDPLSDDLLVILGAPIGAFDERIYPFLQDELRFIEKRLKAQKPLLGICLGAQLIARLLGAKVEPMGVKEIGFDAMQIASVSNNPLQGLENTPVLHWHGDQFALPEGCQSLAATAVCGNQGFTFGDNVLALQFHMEANPLKIEQWLVGHACELHTSGIDIQHIRDDAKAHGNQLVSAAEQVFTGWLSSVGLNE